MKKSCAICGKKIKIILYTDKSYRGGHYFGKIEICSKKEEAKALRLGTHPYKIAGRVFDVLNYDPKPYKYLEYWECPKCYWGQRLNPKAR